MGGPRERVRAATASSFDLDEVAAAQHHRRRGRRRTRRDRSLALAPGLDDALFEHDGQLTKRDIRAVTLSALAPRQGELLWDVGLGAGSIAIEWLLRHPSLKAIGIEEKRRACGTARRAMRRRSARRICRSSQGARRRRSRALPAPDAVFIGGGLADAGVFDAVWAALEAGRPAGRQRRVARARKARLIDAFQRHGGELVRLAGRQGRTASAAGLRLAAGDAGHAMAGEQAMIVAGVGCRRGTSADELETRRAPGAGRLPAAGRAARRDCRPNRRRRPSRPSRKRAQRLSVPLTACTRRRISIASRARS